MRRDTHTQTWHGCSGSAGNPHARWSCGLAHRDVLQRLVPPGVPAETLTAGEKLKVGARGNLFHEGEERLGLAAVLTARPVPPRRLLPFEWIAGPAPSEDHELGCICERSSH